MSFRYPSLNKLRDTLEATNVISKDYRMTIISWACGVAGEAHEAGCQDTLKRWLAHGQRWRRKSDGIEGIILNVVKVRKPSPAHEKGRRDFVRISCIGADALFTELEVSQDELVKDWTRAA